MTKKRIGEVLLEAGLITRQDLDEALADQKALGGRIATILFEKSLISEHEFLLAVSSQMGIPAMDFSKITIKGEVIKLISKDVAWKHMVLPVKILKADSGNWLLLAMAEPRDADAIHFVESITGLKVRPALALERDIRKVLMEYFDANYGQGDYRYSADELRQAAPRQAPPRPAPAIMSGERKPEKARPDPGGKPDDEVFLGKSAEREGGEAHAELEDRLIGEVFNVKLATEAVLRMLIQKGVITAEEYRETLRDLRMKQLGKAGPPPAKK
ncbi:MAG TPA: hypothetical protein VM658_05175 [bacterium]|nr:hypothetical protein [bacterium]